MTEKHRKIIRKNFTKLCDNMRVDDQLLGLFFSEEIIEIPEMQEIGALKSDVNRAHRLLLLLMTREDRSFQVLIEGCKRYNMPHLAQLLEQAAAMS